MNPNQLLGHKQSLKEGRIDKAVFIQSMYNHHGYLFDYVACLKDVNIAEIRISEDGVVAEFKDPRVTMICPQGDLRIAPIEALNFGDYEHDEIQIVRNIIDKLGGSTVRFFDIGANAGFYSLALSYYFPGIEGFAFEPVPLTFSYLETNFAMNGVTAIKPLNIGLSNKQDELVFYTYPSQSGASSMTHNVESPDVQEVRCKIEKLDQHPAGESGAVGLIKCDVEGAELFVFQGAEGVLRRDQPVVFTEMLRKWCAKYDYHPNDIIAFFAELQYCCFTMKGTKLVPSEMVTPETLETNFLFLHAVKHADLIAELS